MNCGKILGSIFVPNFYSPTDYEKIQIDNLRKGTFLVKKNFVKQLKQSDKIGGELSWNSGKFSFTENSGNDYETPKFLKEEELFYNRKDFWTVRTSFSKKRKGYLHRVNFINQSFLKKISSNFVKFL